MIFWHIWLFTLLWSVSQCEPPVNSYLPPSSSSSRRPSSQYAPPGFSSPKSSNSDYNSPQLNSARGRPSTEYGPPQPNGVSRAQSSTYQPSNSPRGSTSQLNTAESRPSTEYGPSQPTTIGGYHTSNSPDELNTKFVRSRLTGTSGGLSSTYQPSNEPRGRPSTDFRQPPRNDATHRQPTENGPPQSSNADSRPSSTYLPPNSPEGRLSTELGTPQSTALGSGTSNTHQSSGLEVTPSTEYGAPLSQNIGGRPSTEYGPPQSSGPNSGQSTTYQPSNGPEGRPSIGYKLPQLNGGSGRPSTEYGPAQSTGPNSGQSTNYQPTNGQEGRPSSGYKAPQLNGGRERPSTEYGPPQSTGTGGQPPLSNNAQAQRGHERPSIDYKPSQLSNPSAEYLPPQFNANKRISKEYNRSPESDDSNERILHPEDFFTPTDTDDGMYLTSIEDYDYGSGYVWQPSPSDEHYYHGEYEPRPTTSKRPDYGTPPGAGQPTTSKRPDYGTPPGASQPTTNKRPEYGRPDLTTQDYTFWKPSDPNRLRDKSKSKSEAHKSHKQHPIRTQPPPYDNDDALRIGAKHSSDSIFRDQNDNGNNRNDEHNGYDIQKPGKYNFSYGVDDTQTGTSFSHSEQRNGDSATGKYNVLLPDGRKQVVEYEAGLQGFKPQIRYEGAGVSNTRDQGYPKQIAPNEHLGEEYAPQDQGYEEQDQDNNRPGADPGSQGRIREQGNSLQGYPERGSPKQNGRENLQNENQAGFPYEEPVQDSEHLGQGQSNQQQGFKGYPREGPQRNQETIGLGFQGARKNQGYQNNEGISIETGRRNQGDEGYPSGGPSGPRGSGY